MRKPILLAAAAAAALAATGTAVAHRLADRGVTVTSSSFTATAARPTRSRSCTDAAGHVWWITNGVYTGQATGQLAGTVTIHAQSVVDTTTGAGFTHGTLQLREPGMHPLGNVRLDGVITQNGTIDGFLGGGTRAGRLYANFSGTLAADGSSLSGQLGSGGGSNTAVLYGGLPKCKQQPPKPAPQRPILRAHGTVTSASSTTLTIAAGKRTITVNVPSSLAATAAALKSGDRIALTAAYIDGAYTLVTLRTHR